MINMLHNKHVFCYPSFSTHSFRICNETEVETDLFFHSEIIIKKTIGKGNWFFEHYEVKKKWSHFK